jgi:hypothetical protein
MDEQRVTVKSLAGATFALAVDTVRTTVADVKALIGERQGGLPAALQRLIFCGHELEDHHTLAQCGIAHDTCVHLVERSDAAPALPNADAAGNGSDNDSAGNIHSELAADVGADDEEAQLRARADADDAKATARVSAHAPAQELANTESDLTTPVRKSRKTTKPKKRKAADDEPESTAAAARAEAEAKARTDAEAKTTAAVARAAAERTARAEAATKLARLEAEAKAKAHAEAEAKAAAKPAASAAAVPTIARRAGDGAAMLRVVGKAMHFFAPQAKRALAACFLPLPVSQRTLPYDDGYPAQLTISVEAVGSGIVIVPALQVYQDTTVGALKALIEARCVPVPSGAIRVFVGHGGEELADDLQSVCAATVADGATLVLVRIFPRETLLRLWEATGGGQWRRQSGWGPSSTALLSAWKGVVCNEAGGVVSLTLERNKLSGACMQGAENAQLVRTAFVSRPHAEPLGYLACVGEIDERAYEFNGHIGCWTLTIRNRH